MPGPAIETERGRVLPVRYRDVATGRGGEAWVGREAIVELPTDTTGDAALGIVRQRAVMERRGLYLVHSARDGEDGLDLAVRLQRDARFGSAPGAVIKQALPDLHFRRKLDAAPNDPRLTGQWYFSRIAIASAWELTRGSADTTIVVVDNGCDQQHADLVNKIDQGRDVLDGDDDPSYEPNVEGNNHGTACAGIIGAETDNAIGIAGACPNCRLRCVRMLARDPNVPVPLSADVDAFDYAMSVNASVVSNSWGFVEAIPVPTMLKDAIETVHRDGRGGLGTLVVFAAGNDDRALLDDELNAVPGVITVGAVNNFGEVAQFSNFGPSVDLVAPLGTLSTDITGADGSDPTDYTSTFGGTSSACPIVAGVLGLMVSAAPDKTAAELEDVLLSTAKQSIFATPDATGHDDYYGRGEIQAFAAVQPLVPSTPPKKKSGCAIGDGADAGLWGLLIVWGASVLTTRRRGMKRSCR